MSTERAIQAAVARADLIISTILRKLPIVAVLTVVLLLAVITVRRWAGFQGYSPYWIDYDAPGVDITSEGPDDDVGDWR